MGTPYLDLKRGETADGEFTKTGFLPAGPDPTNELGASVGMTTDGRIIYINPANDHHGQQIPDYLKVKIEWNC